MNDLKISELLKYYIYIVEFRNLYSTASYVPW